MRDRTLETRISDLEELISLWDYFYQMIESVAKGASFTDEHNKEFLDVKSSIARKFQAIADKFERRTFPEEDLTSVLSEAISLEQASKMSSFTAGQFQSTWHRVYISLNKILGHLESERDSLRKINWLSFSSSRLLRNKLFIFLLVVGLMLCGMFFGYKYYVQSLKPAIEQIEKEEAGEEIEPGKEAGETQVELVELIRDLRGLVAVVRKKVEKTGPGAERFVVGGATSFYYLISGVVGAILCGWMASTRGKSPIVWGFLGFLCCPITFIVLLLKI